MTASGSADIVAFTDEAGLRGPLRDLTPDKDGELGLLCSVPIPVVLLDAVKAAFGPLFDRFKAAAPTGAKLHITDAFKPGHERWRKVAEQVRSEIFDRMREMRMVVIYSARRGRLAREVHERTEKSRADALDSRKSDVKIVGANRPSDERLEDCLMIMLSLLLDEFAEKERAHRIDVLFDEVDAAVADRFTEALNRTRRVTSSVSEVRGYDPSTKERLSREVRMEVVDPPFRLDAKYLGSIEVVGKDDPLVFVADVVTNSLWRHLASLPNDAPLNEESSVADWRHGDHVWGRSGTKNFDAF